MKAITAKSSIYLALGNESAKTKSMMQIIIGSKSSIFRLTFCCVYLANTKTLAPNDKIIEPVLTAPVTPITNPIDTTVKESLLI